MLAAFAVLLTAEQGPIERALHQLAEGAHFDPAARLRWQAAVGLIRGTADKDFWPVIAAMARQGSVGEWERRQ